LPLPPRSAVVNQFQPLGAYHYEATNQECPLPAAPLNNKSSPLHPLDHISVQVASQFGSRHRLSPQVRAVLIVFNIPFEYPSAKIDCGRFDISPRTVHRERMSVPEWQSHVSKALALDRYSSACTRTSCAVTPAANAGIAVKST